MLKILLLSSALFAGSAAAEVYEPADGDIAAVGLLSYGAIGCDQDYTVERDALVAMTSERHGIEVSEIYFRARSSIMDVLTKNMADPYLKGKICRKAQAAAVQTRALMRRRQDASR